MSRRIEDPRGSIRHVIERRRAEALMMLGYRVAESGRFYLKKSA